MSSNSTPVNQHKRLAMGQKVGFARGGSVSNVTPVGAGKMVPTPGAGMGASPLTVARRNNGIPGMRGGGKVKK